MPAATAPHDQQHARSLADTFMHVGEMPVTPQITGTAVRPALACSCVLQRTYVALLRYLLSLHMCHGPAELNPATSHMYIISQINTLLSTSTAKACTAAAFHALTANHCRLCKARSTLQAAQSWLHCTSQQPAAASCSAVVAASQIWVCTFRQPLIVPHATACWISISLSKVG